MSLERALRSLEGLSVGDAFGQQFFGAPGVVWSWIVERYLPPAPWPWTDDTAMALSIVRVLGEHHQIKSDALAAAFAEEYAREPHRGYGNGAHALFNEMRAGASWQQASRGLFGREGSLGNGAAMRVAPVGAFFADDLEALIENAKRSARVTHAHHEGIAGAIAVAVAAAWACKAPDQRSMLELARDLTPPGAVRDGLQKALRIESLEEAARVLGNGAQVTAADTVPFCLWCANRHHDNYEEALWATVSALGDRDTTCAIVGGIVALSDRTIPTAWLEAREPLSGFPLPGGK